MAYSRQDLKNISWITLGTVYLFAVIAPGAALTVRSGGSIGGHAVWRKSESPYRITSDVLVLPGSTLTIEPGVEVQFDPKVMLAVNGTLVARGRQDARITLTKSQMTGQEPPSWPSDIRLVDERSVNIGRLQLLYRGRWRGICANFQNWTATDTTVACRQLGFSHGNFSFLSWARNDSLFMLYHRPECRGTEGHMLECPGAKNIKIGARVCLNQETIHLDCYGLAPNSPAQTNWWGLEFYNATHMVDYSDTNDKVALNKSASVLEYVDMMYAGLDGAGESVPAIRASPHAPYLIDVNLMFHALDATNFTDLKGAMMVRDCTMSRNRGHGLVVETHLGHFHVLNSDLSENAGNGIKAKFLDGKWITFDRSTTFCNLANLGDMRFPQVLLAYPNREITYPCTCCTKTFITAWDQRLTVNILEMEIEEAASGEVAVYEGLNPDRDPLLARWQITNGSLPQGITSRYNKVAVKFTWSLPWRCPLLYDCVKFVIQVDTGFEPVPEFFMNNTRIHNNTGHGIFMENVRSTVVVNQSDISFNKYGAGLQVLGGAGDIMVNSSIFNYNMDNGINITYGGGYRLFNLSHFSYNHGNGINITFNETRVDNKTRIPKNQRTEVSKSYFRLNEGMGVRVGNYCQHGNAILNDSYFIQNQGAGIELDSCYQLVTQYNRTNFTIGYNEFSGNYGHAIKITPLLNAVGRIANNTFTNHFRHTLLIDNTDDFLLSRTYKLYHVNYEIHANHFRNNRGFYVAHIRLTQDSTEQYMSVSYNRFEDNIITGAFPRLNERTRAYGVVVLSSNNVNFSRNAMVNPGSKYEITTHLLEKNVAIQVARQWWGKGEDEKLYEYLIHRLFGQQYRYNLAEIKYHPALAYDRLYDHTVTVTDRLPELAVEFDRGLALGGHLPSEKHKNGFTTEANMEYYIDRDINVRPGAHLIVSPGTVFHFDNAIGMLIQGELKIQGTENNPVTFTLGNDTTFTNHSRVRLVGGATEYEGRVEVRPNENTDEWGTVCKEGWTIVDASVVCQMLGLVVHPDDWFPNEPSPGRANQPIWRSYVRCTELDMDITRCDADHEMDHSCNHTMDVRVRCKPPTWAGMRFLATANSAILHHATISKAGLMDPTTIWYSPAITIDYNVHSMSNLRINHCMSTAVEIMKNDVFTDAKIRFSEISNNLGIGILTRGAFFTSEFNMIKANYHNGLEYNPTYSTEEARQIRQGIHECKFITNGLRVHIEDRGYMFLCTQERSQNEQTDYKVHLSVTVGHRIVVDILDYTPETQIENVTICDNNEASCLPHTRRWRIEEDLVDFPIESRLNELYMLWHVNGAPSGRLTFILRSKPVSWGYPLAKLMLRNTTFDGNLRGVVTRHYNQPSDQYLNLFFRHRFEEITMFGIHVTRSKQEAIHAPSITKYHDLYMPSFEELQTPLRLAEITYRVDGCSIYNNARSIRAEHNHVEFSNNVWVWEVIDNEIMNNEDGGFEIELPKVNVIVNIPAEKLNHTVEVSSNHFHDNKMFSFRIDGFYCNTTMAFNRFFRNTCKMGCITYSGTEKEMDIRNNEIRENTGVYMMEFKMNSHMYYTMWIDARVEFNEFKQNQKAVIPGWEEFSSRPTTYALGIKGLQNITLFRNLFSNSMAYELVAGQASSLLENYVDVRENWWGSSDQIVIKEKIFDFDDWNNYAIAEYFPYLTRDAFNSPISTGKRIENVPDLSRPLGGRIEGHFVIPFRHQPYLVKSDMTVMPSGSLVIEPGVELQFYPNVGILVLGAMSVRGREDNRVKMMPIKRQPTTYFMKRDITVAASDIRLNGGDNDNEGFLEIYNATEGRWTIICDRDFNDRTAEVACRTMGKEDSNVIVRRSQLYDHFVFGYPKMHEQKVEWFWRYTHICDGMELSLNLCRYRINYDIRQCMERRDYVYVRCGPRNLESDYEYWGNLRFSSSDFEESRITPGISFLDYVNLTGAGMLHMEKSAAVEAVYQTPRSDSVTVEKSAWNGYDYIAPKDAFEVSNGWIVENNGYGVGGLVLNTESRYLTRQSSFVPLVESTIPYNVFGLVRMCTTEKIVDVENRILIYYKYKFETIDCMKILRAKERFTQLGLRFLQLNIYNDTYYENAVEMYNGEYLEPQFLIAKVNGNTTGPERGWQYTTTNPYDVMGLRITASAAYGSYGFIAEVYTLPRSTPPDRESSTFKQRINRNHLSHNQGGGFQFANAGELNPSLIIEENRIIECGVQMLNMTGPPVMNIHIQNSLYLTVSNNYINKNKGGSYIYSQTASSTAALRANITNNVIVDNTHGDVLHVEGHQYQKVEVIRNYISHNNVEFRNTVAMFGINLNFTNNVMYNNTGRSNINCTAEEKININQRYLGNWLHDNVAIGAQFSTIFVGSAKHVFHYNFFENRWNIFEMYTYNRTKYPDNLYPIVDASENWWGAGYEAFVTGKIWHRFDDENLIQVGYKPFLLSNQSVLEGRCHPGWRQHRERCFIYMGGPLTFQEAKQACYRELATLAWARDHDMEHDLGEMMASSQTNYTEWRTAWIYSDWKEAGRCTCIRNYHLEHHDCGSFKPYICERDPYMTSSHEWLPVIIGGAVAGGVLIILVVLLALACLKARTRKEQRMERRNSLRASLRSSRASIYTGSKASLSHLSMSRSMDSLSESTAKRRRPQLNKPDLYDNGRMDISGVTLDDTETDDISRIKMGYHRPHTPASSVVGYPAMSANSSNYYDSELPDIHPKRNYPPRLENEVTNVIARPAYDHVIRNDAYDGRSIDRSQIHPTRGYPSVSRSTGYIPPPSPRSPGPEPSPIGAMPLRHRTSSGSLSGQGSLAGIVPYPFTEPLEPEPEVIRPIAKKPARPKPRESAM